MLLRDQGLLYLEKHQIIPIDRSALGLLVYVSFSGHSDVGIASCQGTGGLNICDQTENLHLWESLESKMLYVQSLFSLSLGSWLDQVIQPLATVKLCCSRPAMPGWRNMIHWHVSLTLLVQGCMSSLPLPLLPSRPHFIGQCLMSLTPISCGVWGFSSPSLFTAAISRTVQEPSDLHLLNISSC